MTYKEWITKTAAKFRVESDDIELILFNQSDLIPDPNATADKRIAKTALCNEFEQLIPLFNDSEGGYTQSIDKDSLVLWYNLTCASLGRTPITKAKIRNKSKLW